MARMKIEGLDEYAKMLSRLGAKSPEIAKKAVFAGAAVVADEVRKSIQSLPPDRYRKLKPGEMFTGVSETQRKDLLDSMGVAPIDVDNKGNTNTKIGFDGYGSAPTKKYPKGLPNALLARSIESGSSVRKKIRFVYNSVKAARVRAEAEMGRAADLEIEKIHNG